MNKRETHIVTGMTRDLATSRFEPAHVYEAHNIRIRVVGNDSTLLSVTNEKGTEEFELTGSITEIKGTIIGSAAFTNTLVLFTTDTGAREDFIYRVDFDSTFDTASISYLFDGTYYYHLHGVGSLGFNVLHPIEALAVYENENIQKVYWVDGINQPRMINICKGNQSDNSDKFNFNREIGTDAKMTVIKYNSGGEFRPGTVQYCFNYFDKFGQESNIVDVSPLYYISPKDSGLAADDVSGCSFGVTITNLNTNFDFIRLYAIYRSSENATPNVRVVGDYSTGNSEISIADTGVYGSTIDAEALLFIGGQYIIAETLADKDNTLFLGNLKNKVPSIGNISIVDDTILLKDLHQYVGNQQDSLVELYSCAFNRAGAQDSFHPEEEIPVRDYVIPAIEYTYDKNNNRSSSLIKGFKARENYRLGFIAQYKTGQWSEVIWLGDHDEKCLSGLYWFFNEIEVAGEVMNPWGKQLRSAGYTATINRIVVDALLNKGFIKVCPVVVYPTAKDRFVLCQGLLCPTVFNAKDRIENSPYTQSDWRFRPSYNWNRIEDEIQTNATNGYGVGNNSYAPSVPFAYYRDLAANPTMASFEVMREKEFKKYYPTEFYSDPSVVTFHSPDLDSSTELLEDDIIEAKIRLVGFSNGGFGTFRDYVDSPDPVLNSYYTTVGVLPKSTIHTYISMDTPGLGQYSKALTPNNTVVNFLGSSLKSVGYYDNAVDVSSADELKKFSRALNDDMYFNWYTYLWHRHGSLNNHENLTSDISAAGGTKTAVYQRKVISEKTSAYTTYFYRQEGLGPQDNYTINVPLKDSFVFDSDQETVKIFSTAFSGDRNYYGNISEVLPFELSDNSNVRFYDVTTTESEASAGNDFSSGYPIRTELMYDMAAGSQTPSHLQDFNNGVQPTEVKYKTTRHAVLSLGGHDDSEIMQIGVPTPSNYFIYWLNQNKYFAGAYLREHIYGQDTNEQHFNYSFVENCLYIGELYRQMTSEQRAARFGGNTTEAILSNVWTIAGEAVTLEAEHDATIYYKEGDTYFGKYDCLKSYPYTQEDKQSIVSIYSTELESRVNLDFRYGNTMNLDDNTLVTPQNFNLYNHSGYEQTNQYFTYRTIDYDRYIFNEDANAYEQDFPNMITWSKEKTLGEDIDTWTSVPMLSTLDLDGTKGEITKLVRFNNEIIAFQDNAFAQILFNSRVQIPVSDGVPVEITNGYKVDGKRYISESIGMSNKWSMAVSPYALYFADDSKNSLYAYNGQLTDLSSAKGMKTWMYDKGNDFRPVWNPRDYGNLRTFYDKIYGDVYFTTKNTSLVYSEQIGNFTSFMDYGGVTSMNNMGNKFLSFTTSDNDNSKMWEMWEGDYNMFFDEFKPYWMTFIANENPTKDKIFNNLEWRSVVYDKDGNYLPYSTFDTMRIWHEHQDTGCINLKDNIGIPSSLKKKFNAFRTYIPRDAKGLWSPPNMQRIRNPWTYIRLAKIEENTDQMVFTDLNVDFFE